MNEVKVTIEVGGNVAVMVVPDANVSLRREDVDKYQRVMTELYKMLSK